MIRAALVHEAADALAKGRSCSELRGQWLRLEKSREGT